MRRKNILHKAVALLIITLVLFNSNTMAQESKEEKSQQKTELIENLLQSKNFVFKAQYALPATSRSIYLTSQYDVRIMNDTIISDLPFFGRAYVATMNPSDAGIHFTSTKFEYSVSEKKKGGWKITILPKDTRDVRQMYLTVSSGGNASLQVISNNRQAMNFTGSVSAINKRI